MVRVGAEQGVEVQRQVDVVGLDAEVLDQFVERVLELHERPAEALDLGCRLRSPPSTRRSAWRSTTWRTTSSSVTTSRPRPRPTSSPLPASRARGAESAVIAAPRPGGARRLHGGEQQPEVQPHEVDAGERDDDVAADVGAAVHDPVEQLDQAGAAAAGAAEDAGLVTDHRSPPG